MVNVNRKRLEKHLFKKIGDILIKMSDSIVKYINITKLEVTKDKKRAILYFFMSSGKYLPKSKQKAIEGYLRKEIAKTMQLKYIPEIIMKTDNSMIDEERIEELFKQIEKEKDIKNNI